MSFIIDWNGVFSRKVHLRPFAADRVYQHFYLRDLWSVEPPITCVIIRCVDLSFLIIIDSRAGVLGTAKVGTIRCDVVT